jgi:CBS domain-containing protein
MNGDPAPSSPPTLGTRREQQEFMSLMLVRVCDAVLRAPFYLDSTLDLVSACRLLAAEKRSDALVRDGARIGMFTTTDLRDALLQPLPPSQLTLREVAHFGLITIDADAEVFEALLLMLRHRVHRVVVMRGERIEGVLSQLDLMGFVSSHSHLIALQIGQAGSVEALKTAAAQMDGLIELLHGGGIKVEVISRLARELNAQLFARLWALLAPPQLVANSCLLVMGSEGRGEQILKTDQDNALLLRDGFEFNGLQALADRVIEALLEFGYPRCPGDIMLSNPLWRQPLAGFKNTIRHWLYGADPQGPMHLAIFLDADAVAGDATLLQQANAYLHEIMVHNDAFLARFAAAADQFQEPGAWWSRLTPWRALRGPDDTVFDLKKLGTFPIVHGVRALALQHQVAPLSTTERLQALVQGQHLPAELARDLTEALHFLMALKLKYNLRQRQAGQPASNEVRLSELGTLEGDQLKDALVIIKRFRQHLQQHFRLDSL